MNALPIIVGALCVIAIAYRYYSAFIAAKVLALDDSRPVPSQTMYDGHNYYPTNKWVLFGHHFAAISGAGPLIGPVLAVAGLCLVVLNSLAESAWGTFTFAFTIPLALLMALYMYRFRKGRIAEA